ncbi:hypothetical protein Sps_04384 [Shewanella psychrophila]|uniref:Uncharacterized protein n=1 Tax=Shewanella psychrophila TaxID=225848 RepID=A0A1S6HV84_9GAMM|nr:hypothetical protein [Shewanella psychrophila]AQS39476.1 hypothetical protein Sps_04384 [Shewanella psychrophila]
MEKAAYLDAMGIKRWVQSSNAAKTYFILVDKVESGIEHHPVINSVLSLIECPITSCSFSEQVSKGADVIWDMRRLKMPKSNSVLSSEPLAELIIKAGAKRDLWNLIVAHNKESEVG